MAETKKFERLLQLYNRFRDDHARMTIGDMMTRYGINRRTANRDLEELRNTFHLDLVADKLDSGENSWHVPSGKVRVDYNVTDLMALFLGRRLFDFLEGTLLEQSLDKVYGKIETQLQRLKDVDLARDLRRRVWMVSEGPKKLSNEHVEHLDEVLDAMVHNRHLALSYRSLAGVEHEHTLLPYTLVAYRRGLYLIAAFEDSGEPRTYALERITRAESKKGTRFTLPKDYTPAAYFGSALFIKPGTPEKVELVFAPGTYDFIRIREFHPSQTLERLPDGHLLMTLEVPAAEGEWEIENFVLSFGKYVEVRSPEHLRERVAKAPEAALAKYQ